MTAIPLFEIEWDEREISNVVRSVARGSYWAKGPYVDAFEQEIERFLDVEHAITVNSGTSALVACLEAHDVGSGDEVVVPSFSFIATANAVRIVGAKPVFADIEPDTYGLDPESVVSNLSDRTAAILPVHCYGAPAAELSTLAEIATDYGVALIEDAAEAFGATQDGRSVGTIGDSAALSFCQNKVVTTGEGGAVVTDDDEIAQRVRLYRSHGRSSDEYFDDVGSGEYVSLGTNLRMADVNAAIGCAQMEKVSDLVERRQSVGAAYCDRLTSLDGVTPHTPAAGDEHVYQLFTVELSSDIDRPAVVEMLEERGVACKVYWDPPIHRTQAYHGAGDRELPTTNDVAGSVLSLPMYPSLETHQIDRVVAAVSDALDRA